jgi:protein subunit release factor A
MNVERMILSRTITHDSSLITVLMSFFDILQLALRNLRQAKLRATLTTMGVVVGVAVIVTMVSFGLVEIDERDLDIDVYRSSGAGGQSVNTTDSAVRITHRPTGVVVTMQDERSQLQNKARAMQVLRARLVQLAKDEHDAAMSIERRSQVGGGGRGEKIRTYNYKENRLTDHRIGFTIYRLADVLAGDLGDVVDALIADERARQLTVDE